MWLPVEAPRMFYSFVSRGSDPCQQAHLCRLVALLTRLRHVIEACENRHLLPVAYNAHTRACALPCEPSSLLANGQLLSLSAAAHQYCTCEVVLKLRP